MLIQYLLGQASETEREEIEARYFADDEFFGQIKMVEDQLIDDYLNDKLPLPLREQFEREYLRLPERRKKVELAGELLRYTLAKKGIATSSPPVLKTGGASETDQAGSVVSLQAFLTQKQGNRSWKRWLAAAAMLVMALGTGWVFREIARLRQELTQTQAIQTLETKRAAEIEHQLAAERAKTETLTSQLETERMKRNQLEENLQKLRQSQSTSSSGTDTTSNGLLACILLPNLARSSSGDKPVHLSPAIRAIRFRLVLRNDLPDQTLSVQIRTVDGVEVWRQENLAVRKSQGQKFVNLHVPGETFAHDDYVIELGRHTSAETTEKVATYNFATRRH